MSTIAASTTTTTAYTVTADTTGALVLQTGATPTTAVSISASQVVTLTNALGLAYGGSGQTSAQSAMNTFAGAVTSGSYLRGNGTNVVMNTIQAADVPTLNQNTTGSAATVTGNATGSTFGFNSGYGSVATAYGCRAWISWTDNGTATTTRGSGNVTSITRNATSDYTINFTNAMPDVNYSVAGNAGYNTTSMAALVVPINLTAPTTSAVRVQAVSSDGVLRSVSANVAFYSVNIFR
jgi:hypothetical protein